MGDDRGKPRGLIRAAMRERLRDVPRDSLMAGDVTRICCEETAAALHMDVADVERYLRAYMTYVTEMVRAIDVRVPDKGSLYVQRPSFRMPGLGVVQATWARRESINRNIEKGKERRLKRDEGDTDVQQGVVDDGAS